MRKKYEKKTPQQTGKNFWKFHFRIFDISRIKFTVENLQFRFISNIQFNLTRSLCRCRRIKTASNRMKIRVIVKNVKSGGFVSTQRKMLIDRCIVLQMSPAQLLVCNDILKNLWLSLTLLDYVAEKWKFPIEINSFKCKRAILFCWLFLPEKQNATNIIQRVEKPFDSFVTRVWLIHLTQMIQSVAIRH